MVSAKHHEIRPYFTSTRGWKWWGLAFIQMFLILTAQTGFDWEPCNLSVLCVESTLTSCQSISPSLHLASKKWIPNNTLTGSNENCMLLGKLQFLKDFSIPRVRNPHAGQGSRTGLTTGAPRFLGSKPHVFTGFARPEKNRTKATVFWWKWLWTICWKFGNYCYHFVCHYMMNTMAKHWWIWISSSQFYWFFEFHHFTSATSKSLQPRAVMPKQHPSAAK